MRTTGLKYINLGEDWRRRYLHGSPIEKIAAEDKEDPQTISRAIWLAKIPSDIKEKIKNNPEIFTRRILQNQFAAKRKQCEKDGFTVLRLEVDKMIQNGPGSKPKLKTNKKKKTTHIEAQNATQKPSQNENIEPSSIDPTYHIESSIEAEYLIKQALGYHCRVAFDKNGGGEVRIFFNNKKALNGLIETIQSNAGMLQI